MSNTYEPRTYRHHMGDGRFRSCVLQIGESDLWIGFDTDCSASDNEVIEEVSHVIRKLRNEIMASCEQYPQFIASHLPIQAIDNTTSQFISSMLEAGVRAKVGPMASVAGAVAQAVGRYCKQRWSLSEVVVENGGDLYVDVVTPLSVQVVAPRSVLSGKVAVVVDPQYCPLGVCTSSGTVGHSHSYGKADAVMIACKDTALADAWATSWCNKVQGEDDISEICTQIQDIAEIVCGIVIVNDRIGLCGSLEVCAI